MQTLDKELLEINIQKVAEFDFEQKKVFGSAYCVYQKDQMIYQKCFGYTSTNETEPISENTLFRLASMTKPITAVAVLILVEKGMLSLDEPIYKYLPEFKEWHFVPTIDDELVDKGITNVHPTIKNLLTHTSGIGGGAQKWDSITTADKKDIDNYIAFCLKVGLEYEPGTRQQYSGMEAFDILAKIIERVSGVDYWQFLKRELLEPCEMHDTVFVPSEEQWKRLVSMHMNIDGENAVDTSYNNRIFMDFPCTHYLGGAGLVSTLSDYIKFAKMLLNNGRVGTKQLLSKEVIDLLHTPHVSSKIMPGPMRWGLGVRVIVDESYKELSVGTYGWSGAFGTHFWVDPENEMFAIFLKNSRIDGGSETKSGKNFEKAVYNSYKM